MRDSKQWSPPPPQQKNKTKQLIVEMARRHLKDIELEKKCGLDMAMESFGHYGLWLKPSKW